MGRSRVFFHLVSLGIEVLRWLLDRCELKKLFTIYREAAGSREGREKLEEGKERPRGEGKKGLEGREAR